MESEHEDPASDLAQSVLQECWNEFYNSYLPHYVEKSSQEIYHASGKINLMNEELDRSVFETPAKNDLMDLHPQLTRLISYVDENELDIRDELIEPESQNTELWEEKSAPKPVPGYSAYTHLRQNSYLRGDLWIDEQGIERRLPQREQRNGQYINDDLMDRNDDRVCTGKINNAESRGDVAHNQELLAFIPPELWGAPERDLGEYCEAFHGNEVWRDSKTFWENDEDIIEAAVVQRLLSEHNMAPELIDKTKVLSRTVKTLCKVLHHRTYPRVATIHPRNAQLAPLPIKNILETEMARTPYQMALDTAVVMCYHVDCYAYMPCRVHYQAFHRVQRKDPGIHGRGPLHPKFHRPKLTSRQLIAQTRREKYPVCENDCFQRPDAPLEPNNSNDEIVVHVDESELAQDVQDELELNWKQLPDAIPCDIAIMGWGLYTCRQAYLARNKLFPDMIQLESDDSDDGRATGRKLGKPKPFAREKLPATKECDHDGECIGNPKCLCFASGRYCLRDCRCDSECKQRQTGCSCTKSSSTNTCQTSKCKCYMNDRECDPDLCRGCGAKNTQLLLHSWKETKVQPSKFGNGLFLASTQAVNGDLIAEYTGEIIHDRTSARRHLIYSRIKRNYLFNVNRDGVQHDIDAGKAGNETRFINHPLPPDKPNCNAKWKYVGGELRLGIYASKHIYYGYELFLDYGKGFFMDEDNEPGSSNNARSPTPQYEDEVMYEYNTRDDSNDEDWDEEVEYGPSSADSTASPEL